MARDTDILGLVNVETRYMSVADSTNPLKLQSGTLLSEVTLAYETYGTLNARSDNAILIFHALTGSQHVAGYNPTAPTQYWTQECHIGWWDAFVGPGKLLDTNRYYIICANYLGGCYGSTGPATLRDGAVPYGASFPLITASDVVDSQVRLLDALGITHLHAVVGASSGGMLVLNFSVRYPHRVARVIPIAVGLNADTLQRLQILEQIFAIEQDSNYCGGDYYDSTPPSSGLILARMISHKSFVSLNTLNERAGQEIRDFQHYFNFHTLRSSLESYMLHQAEKFARRFDANSYLRILELWMNFDLLQDCNCTSYTQVFAPSRHHRYLVFSIDTDVCFYPERQEELVAMLRQTGVSVQHVTAHSHKGHDSFLLEPQHYTPIQHMLAH